MYLPKTIEILILTTKPVYNRKRQCMSPFYIVLPNELTKLNPLSTPHTDEEKKYLLLIL